MSSAGKFPVVTWQVTATTIICDSAGGEVTIMVYKDGQLKCTGERCRVGGSRKPKSECSAVNCPLVAQYRDKLMAEEVVE